MQLSESGIKENITELKAKGYELPEYDRDLLRENTKSNPEWVHFGAGNIARAYIADIADKLIKSDDLKSGLILCGEFDKQLVEGIYRSHDELIINVTLCADGSMKKQIIGSIAEADVLDKDGDMERLMEIFASPSLKFASFTITEKGYRTSSADEKGFMWKVTALLYNRYKNGALPIAFVSMDNCSHNGDKLKEAVLFYAKTFDDAGFIEYINDPSKVSFPWSMIDKITPGPDESVASMLKDDGFEDLKEVRTARGSRIAPFVNAEETGYLVIEDTFPNGRPPLEKAGVVLCDKETVDKTEKMKVCTCLNPLHTALAIFGCLFDHEYIHDEMEDEDLVRLVNTLGYEEGLPVVIDPGVISPRDFLDAVVRLRLPNPFLPDSPKRIATDTSQKIPIRFGHTVASWRERGRDAGELKAVPLVFAAYIQYLKGVNDKDESFELSPDPLLEELKALSPQELLKRRDVFNSDLFADGLGDRVLALYEEMSKGVGAVRKTLRETLV